MAHLTKKQDIDPQAAELLSQIEILRQLFPDGGKKKTSLILMEQMEYFI